MDGDVADVRVKWILEGEGMKTHFKMSRLVHLEVVKVTGKIKAFPGSISHCPVSVDPAQHCSHITEL